MKCSFCGAENIEGDELCQACGADLTQSQHEAAIPSVVERHLLKDLIFSLDPKEAKTVPPSTNVLAAIELMNKSKIGCLLVTEGLKLVGLLTERDILFKLADDQVDYSSKTVKDIMTANPESLNSVDTIAYAMNKMSVGGFRHVPIIDEKKNFRIISSRDVLRYLSGIFPDR